MVLEFMHTFFYSMHTMKTRVTLTLAPQTIHEAKKLAHRRHTSVSGLVETLLSEASSEKSKPTFVEKWGGALKLSRRNAGEPLFEALKAKYNL